MRPPTRTPRPTSAPFGARRSSASAPAPAENASPLVCGATPTITPPDAARPSSQRGGGGLGFGVGAGFGVGFGSSGFGGAGFGGSGFGAGIGTSVRSGGVSPASIAY